MKKIFAFILTLIFCFALVACGAQERPETGGMNDKTEQGNSEIGDDKNETEQGDSETDDDKNETEQDGDTTGDKNVHGEVNELLTVEELVDFHLNGTRYPENFVFEELNGYGRVIASTSSREDALSMATKHFNSGWCTTVECRLTAETDLFYGLYVKWAYHSGRVDEPTLYYDEYVVSFKKDVYDAENMQFFTKDKDEIKSILNYIHYSRSYQTGGMKVYSSDITLENDKFTYTAYVLTVAYGDWGVQDELNLIKTELQIDFATGETEYDYKVVGTAYIDGAGKNSGMFA